MVCTQVDLWEELVNVHSLTRKIANIKEWMVDSMEVVEGSVTIDSKVVTSVQQVI